MLTKNLTKQELHTNLFAAAICLKVSSSAKYNLMLLHHSPKSGYSWSETVSSWNALCILGQRGCLHNHVEKCNHTHTHMHTLCVWPFGCITILPAFSNRCLFAGSVLASSINLMHPSIACAGHTLCRQGEPCVARDIVQQIYTAQRKQEFGGGYLATVHHRLW